LDFIRTDIDRELDESSLTPHQQVFEKMISGKEKRKSNRRMYVNDFFLFSSLFGRNCSFDYCRSRSTFNSFSGSNAKVTKYPTGLQYISHSSRFENERRI